MFGIRKLHSLLMGNVGHSLGVVAVPRPNTLNSLSNSTLSNPYINANVPQIDHEPMAKALITVFGMDKDGRIAKEKACNVVKQLGLVEEGDEDSSFDDMLEEEEVIEAKEVLSELELEERKQKEQLLRQAFMVFDEDGDGFIDANEIKRVFVCLGLGNGWHMCEIEKMIKVVDVNLDGKVDFHEFVIMMG